MTEEERSIEEALLMTALGGGLMGANWRVCGGFCWEVCSWRMCFSFASSCAADWKSALIERR
jgi:hypothetical protein